jgi:hypothetical protein
MGGAGAPKFCMLKVLCCEEVSVIGIEVEVVCKKKSWQVLVVIERLMEEVGKRRVWRPSKRLPPAKSRTELPCE